MNSITKEQVYEEFKKFTGKQFSTQERAKLVSRICTNLCPELSQALYGLALQYEKEISAKSKKEQALEIIVATLNSICDIEFLKDEDNVHYQVKIKIRASGYIFIFCVNKEIYDLLKEVLKDD